LSKVCTCQARARTRKKGSLRLKAEEFLGFPEMPLIGGLLVTLSNDTSFAAGAFFEARWPKLRPNGSACHRYFPFLKDQKYELIWLEASIDEPIMVDVD